MSFRLKLARVNNLKLKVTTRLPAQLDGGTGVEVTRTNAVYTIDLDFSELAEVTAFAAELEATTFIPAWESVGDDYSRISITNLKADIQATFGGYYQPLDADLTAIAGLTSAANKLPYFTGSATAALADFTAYGRSVVAVADEADFKALVNLEIGTDVQAFDADLSAVAALASTGIARRTGSGTWSVGTAVANSELATMAAYTLKGNATGSSAAPTDIDIAALTTKASPAAGDYILLSDQAASGAFKKATVSSVAAGSTVASIAGNTGAFTLGVGITNATNDIKIDLTESSGTLTNSLGANVPLSNTGTFFDGPAVAQGSSGTWFVSGTVTLLDVNGAAQFAAKLWDGTTVIAASSVTQSAASFPATIALSGVITSPAGNLRISCIDISSTGGGILFNQSGTSKDSTITAIRIA